jgi:outer membrane protein TolC
MPTEPQLPERAMPAGPPSGQAPAHQEGAPYDLPALLDLALRENPDTRFAWESARQAAASFGDARAPQHRWTRRNQYRYNDGNTRTVRMEVA